jgi:hypothetical protein
MITVIGAAMVQLSRHERLLSRVSRNGHYSPQLMNERNRVEGNLALNVVYGRTPDCHNLAETV